ncbi:cobalamin B12-binding domain protein [Oscillochloris trichoides DG-6]|uniref:Cobalamin B12-binding domain protein n=1 Tax=Oscillochloris trichoides DG-6 TaxID=765420 RepID=E1IBS2_9CHLR|nr:cobalamin-dependent protein [Oscillochloris trichoides]EFO81374.1 cobalamin B12-binding domain protein [Oscillochloris trichoides DG-6]
MAHHVTQDLTAALSAVDAAASAAYRECSPQMIAYANEQIAAQEQLGPPFDLLSLEMIYRTHAEHAHYMAEQFAHHDAHALVTMFTWVYRTYQMRGAVPRAFPVDLMVWRDAVAHYLDPDLAAPIMEVYNCLHEYHTALIQEIVEPTYTPEYTAQLHTHIQSYLGALLAPDARAALEAAASYIHGPDQIATWWECVIRQAMYEVGQLWAQGEISVGQEHLATAITQRVMAYYYPQILEKSRNKGHVIVTASPGEHHEVGARILADILELNGWDTYYTGANTPSDTIIDLLAQTKAQVICISTTLPTSLVAVAELIAHIRAAHLEPKPTILVGGQAYLAEPTLWQHVGADWFASSASEGLRYIEGIHSSGGKQ